MSSSSKNNKPLILRRFNNAKTKLPNPVLKTPEKMANSNTTPIKQKPPYSYMAMIEMAINSSSGNRMTLKDIYSWIENNFDYFKTAKPGWKNSIRHNLSLHDIFVRESDEKNSTWSLKIDENRTPLTFETVLAREGKISAKRKLKNSSNPLQDVTKTIKNSSNNRFVNNFCTPVKQSRIENQQFSTSSGSSTPFQKPLLPNPKNTYRKIKTKEFE